MAHPKILLFLFCFSIDKLKCLEEGEDPEVIPEDTDLVTLGYVCFCYMMFTE
jgi:hypothetical protein